MASEPSHPNLAANLGYLHQTRGTGELTLEQNDGIRRLFFKDGHLCYLRSDAVGEQFGNYLIRLGVLDYNALKDLLKEPGTRVGERVVQWGLLTETQRDLRLRELFSSILLHAVEHPVLSFTWNPGGLAEDFNLDHRFLVWEVYRQMHTLDALVEVFRAEESWRWTAHDSLLDAMADLTLTPQTAFALTQLGREPMSYDTMVSVMGLDEGESARLVAALWALGGLELAEPEAAPFIRNAAPGAAAEAEAAPPAPEPPAVEEPILIVPDLDDPTPEPQAIAQEPAAPAQDGAPLLRARTFFQQAMTLNMQGRPGEAIRALEEAIKLDPDSPRSFDAWMLLGDLRQGNPAWSTRAVEAYQVAARVRPRSGDPWLRMGHLYLRKGFAQNARGCFQRAMELDPSLEIPDLGAGAEPQSEEKEGIFGRLRHLLGGERKQP